jgi:hypothetical protein
MLKHRASEASRASASSTFIQETPGVRQSILVFRFQRHRLAVICKTQRLPFASIYGCVDFRNAPVSAMKVAFPSIDPGQAAVALGHSGVVTEIAVSQPLSETAQLLGLATIYPRLPNSPRRYPNPASAGRRADSSRCVCHSHRSFLRSFPSLPRQYYNPDYQNPP